MPQCRQSPMMWGDTGVDRLRHGSRVRRSSAVRQLAQRDGFFDVAHHLGGGHLLSGAASKAGITWVAASTGAGRFGARARLAEGRLFADAFFFPAVRFVLRRWATVPSGRAVSHVSRRPGPHSVCARALAQVR